MESRKPKEESKNPDVLEKQEEKLGKVYINGYSLITGKIKREEVNFSSRAHLETSNEIKKQLSFSKNGGCKKHDSIRYKGEG